MKHKKTEPFTQIPFCVLRQTARSFRFYGIFKVGIFINRLNPVPCGMMLTGRNTDAGGSDGATNCMVGDFATNRLLSGAFLHRFGGTSACRNAGAGVVNRLIGTKMPFCGPGGVPCLLHLRFPRFDGSGGAPLLPPYLRALQPGNNETDSLNPTKKRYFCGLFGKQEINKSFTF